MTPALAPARRRPTEPPAVARGGGVAAGVLGAVVACALVASLATIAAGRPWVAVAIAAGALLLVACVASPYQTALVLAFLTVAFPKAGVNVDDFPVPVFLFGTVLAVLLLAVSATRRRRHGAPTLVLTVLAVAWVGARVALTSGHASVQQELVYVAWAAVPLVVLAVATGIELPDRRLATAMERGFLVAAAFGVLQFLVGVEATKVPGLTISWGDSYARKHNIISGDTGDYSKIMSTYQNGNLFGATAAVFLLVAAVRITWGRPRRHDVLLLGAASLSVVLSGSRAALLAAIVGAACVVLARGRLRRKVLLGAGVAAAALLGLTLQPALARRYDVSGVIASGGAGRTETWAAAMSAMSPVDWLAGMQDVIRVDGAVGLVTAHGGIGVVLMALAVWLLLRGDRSDWRVVWIGLAAAAGADATFMYFPTWFIPALAAAVPIRPPDPGSGGSGSDGPGAGSRPRAAAVRAPT